MCKYGGKWKGDVALGRVWKECIDTDVRQNWMSLMTSMRSDCFGVHSEPPHDLFVVRYASYFFLCACVVCVYNGGDMHGHCVQVKVRGRPLWWLIVLLVAGFLLLLPPCMPGYMTQVLLGIFRALSSISPQKLWDYRHCHHSQLYMSPADLNSDNPLSSLLKSRDGKPLKVVSGSSHP